jgi:HEAT repeat protein
VIRRLGEIGPEARAALPALVRLAEHDRFQTEVCSALASMGGEAIETLRDRLRSGIAIAPSWVLHTISGMRHDAELLIPDIAEMTHDKNDEVRRNAVGVLGRLRLLPAITTPAMAAMLDSKERFDAASAADALGEMEPAAESAIPALEKAATQHADPYVRCRAISALAAVDTTGEATVRALTHGLRDKGSYGFPFTLSVDKVASESLTLKASKASPAASILLEILKSDPLRESFWRYEEISFTLASLGIVDAVPVLQRDLSYDQEGNKSDYGVLFSDRIIPQSYETTCIRTSAAAALR